jgi:hypothetical protein
MIIIRPRLAFRVRTDWVACQKEHFDPHGTVVLSTEHCSRSLGIVIIVTIVMEFGVGIYISYW